MIVEILRMALSSLKVNKLRSFLSMLGIIIGVAAVIAIVSIATSAQQEVISEIQTLGGNLLWVGTGLDRDIQEAENKFTLELTADIKAFVPGVTTVVPEKTGRVTLSKGGESIDAALVGTEPDYAKINQYNARLGRFINDNDLETVSNSIVLGSEIAGEILETTNPVGEEITLNFQRRNYSFEVVGVMEEMGRVFVGNLDSKVYIPVTSYIQRLAQTRNIDTYYVQTGAEAPAERAHRDLDYYFYRHLGNQDDYTIFSQDQVLGVIDEVTTTLNLMLGGVAGISLLVGGIGIMNIMLVSVNERTQEIGVRKALGAEKKHILTQFLFEALSLTSLGGLIGIGLGWGATYFVTNIGGWPINISPAAVGAGFFFALIIGVFFGLYPAYKAASLDPVDALSYE
ncbi:MAG: ABC transporter permease [Bacillota bacterium]